MKQRLRDTLTWQSRAKYLSWRAMGSPWPIRLTIDSGARIIVRPPPSTDLATANEVFAKCSYRSPRSVSPIRSILDLGANVGYSIVYWLTEYPDARVVAYEPHPVHCCQVRAHLEINHATDRVTLVEAAVGSEAGEAVLSDDESRSSIVNATAGLRVPVVDLFSNQWLEFDLIKIDIEGAEYGLLSDPRFVNLKPKAIVLEWHVVSGIEGGHDWCLRRFAELGYDAISVWRGASCGVIWALSRAL